MDKGFAKQIIGWAEEAKETLSIRKEIIMDDNTTDEELGMIVRMMYGAKVKAQDETILKTKQNSGLWENGL
jgi:nicotinate-nucleotide pyrophosphorylase